MGRALGEVTRLSRRTPPSPAETVTATTAPWACAEAGSSLGGQHLPSRPEKCASPLACPARPQLPASAGAVGSGEKEATGQGPEGRGRAASRSVGRCCGSGREAEAETVRRTGVGTEGRSSSGALGRPAEGRCGASPPPAFSLPGRCGDSPEHSETRDSSISPAASRGGAGRRKAEPAEPATRVAASGGARNVPREHKTIIFDNLHQYHLHPPAPDAARLSPPPHRGRPSSARLVLRSSRELNKPIVSSIDLIWGPENSADSTVLNY